MPSIPVFDATAGLTPSDKRIEGAEIAPDAFTIIYCFACHKPTNGKSWYGPGCQCDEDQRRGEHAARSVSAGPRSNWG